MVRSSAQLTADSGLPLHGGAQGALLWPPGTPGTPSQPPLPASSHSAARAFSPEIYLCSCSKSGPKVLIFFFLHFPLPPTAADHSKARKGWVHPHVRPRPAAARGADALSACGALSRDASSPTSSFCTFGACSLTFTDKGLLLHLHNLHDS